MKRYRFPLQSVLAVRQAGVHHAEAQLAKKQRSCQTLQNELARLREAEAKALAEVAAGEQSEGSRQWDLSFHSAYLDGLGEKIMALETKLVAEQADAVRLRDVLTERSKEERVIEQLKKRKSRAFRMAIARKEQEEIDEAASGRWTAKARRAEVG
jgi:flagellar export protein FliJ